MAVFVLLAVLFVLLFATVVSVEWRHRRRARDWRVLDEGEMERVQYGHFYDETRSGAMVHSTTRLDYRYTVIHFADGRTRVLRAIISMRHPRGTKIRIWVNGNSDYRIEAA